MDTGDLTSEIVCSLDGVNTETDYNGDRNDMLERDIQVIHVWNVFFLMFEW